MAEAQDAAETKDGGPHWTRQVLGAIGGLVLTTGVFGTVIGAYLQQRNWTYQKRAEKVDRDAGAAVAALEDINKVIEEKFLSAYGLHDAIKTRQEGESLDAAARRFFDADRAWERQHQSLAATLEIIVDSQFGVDDLAAIARAQKSGCAGYALDGLAAKPGAPLPVGAVLELVYTCQVRLKEGIEAAIGARKANGGAWPTPTPDPDPGRMTLGHVWRVQKVLQCLMVQRAVEIRGQPVGVPILSLGPDRASPYELGPGDRAREDRCVAPYRDDPGFGAAAARPG